MEHNKIQNLKGFAEMQPEELEAVSGGIEKNDTKEKWTCPDCKAFFLVPSGQLEIFKAMHAKSCKKHG